MLTSRLFTLLIALGCQLPIAFCQLQFVNPFIGTGGHGHTYPGATAPFGLVQLSPDTRLDLQDWDGCSGYHYSDSTIYGFSHTHLSGTGVADYCDILFMPFVGGARLEPDEYGAHFQKKNEHAEAGYYSVLLDRDQIQCELTATDRVGVHRYTFPPNQTKGSLVIDLRHRDSVLNAHLEVLNDREIAGYRISTGWAKEQHVYFVARFSTPFFSSIVLDMAQNPRLAEPSITSKAIVGLLNFYTNNEPIVVTVGISGVSMEGARRNLEQECDHFDFNKIKAETQAKWQQQLSKIAVEGGTNDQKTIFYTALYHTMLAPNIWNDVDGQYRGRDNKIHPNPGHDVYTVFSLWDTHRALHPLLTILEPKRTNDFIQTFLRQYEQGGLLPVWELAANETDCMIGNHAISVIADAYAKGFHGFDAQEALTAMIKSANQDRLGLKEYRTRGYIPADKEPESVSKTLEYAYDDWCIAKTAQKMGLDSIAKEYFHRSQSYINLFDPSTGFFRAKTNATWYQPFDPYEVNFNYTEANAWQYRFSVPQDVTYLNELMGGPEMFSARLDSLFSTHSKTSGRDQADITGQIGQYVQGNEPSHHIAYLYNYINQSWKTQQRVRQIMDEQYANRPDGLSGNEDCGQMSAWLVFSAMGFYPINVRSYTLGTPWFEKMSIHLPNTRAFTILASGASSKNCYIKNTTLNGKSLFNFWLDHLQMTNEGGELVLEMTDQPIRTAPMITSKSQKRMVATPFVKKGKRSFEQQQEISLGSIDSTAVIYYQEVSENGKTSPVRKYTNSIKVKKSGRIALWSERDGQRSATDTFSYQLLDNQIKAIQYNTMYSPQYTAHGNDGLIDGIRGGADFRTGDWQGFEGVPLDVVLDLGKSKKIKQLTIGFLQDENAWIFFPKMVQVEISDDGKTFRPAASLENEVAVTEKGTLQKDFMLDLYGKKARYVRVVGVAMGECPPEHKGAGHPCWIFADEIIVE